MKYFINFSLLRHHRNFRLLFLGQSVSFFGTMITSVALPYQIYHETYSTLMVGLLSLSQLLPLLLTALLGGVLADRRHRQKLLLLAESFLALGSLTLALNAYSANVHLSIIFIVAAFMSGMTGLHRPAMDSLVQQIVPKRDLPLVSPLISATRSVSMILGPSIGGLIIVHFGLVATFTIDIATFLFSLLCISLITSIVKPKASLDQSAVVDLKQGMRYAASRQELLGSYFVDFIAMIFGMPMALFPAIAHNFGGAKTLGFLYSAPAVGALIISFASGWTKNVTRHGVAIAVAAGFWGIAIIFFGLSSKLWLALLFLAIAGGADALSGIFRQTLWNQTIPNEYRGRLSGIEMISYMSGPKLGDTEAGLVAAAFGITASIVSGGVLCIAGIAICCYCLPKFWRYRSNKEAL